MYDVVPCGLEQPVAHSKRDALLAGQSTVNCAHTGGVEAAQCVKESVRMGGIVGLRAEALHMGSVGKQAALLVKAQNPRARLL